MAGRENSSYKGLEVNMCFMYFENRRPVWVGQMGKKGMVGSNIWSYVSSQDVAKSWILRWEVC